MALLLIVAVAVLAGAAAGLWALDRRLASELTALDGATGRLSRLRGALDELRRAVAATAAAHDRVGAAAEGPGGSE